MKKILFIMTFILLLLVSCSEEAEQRVVKISFETNGGNEILEIEKNIETTLPIPEKEGFNFLGWFEDENFNKAVDLNKLNKDTVLYAKWEIKQYTVEIIEKTTNTIISTQKTEYNQKLDLTFLYEKGYIWQPITEEELIIKKDTKLIIDCNKVDNMLLIKQNKEDLELSIINAKTIGFYIELETSLIDANDVSINLKNASYKVINNGEKNIIKIIFSDKENIVKTINIGNIKKAEVKVLDFYSYILDENNEVVFNDTEYRIIEGE